MELPIEPGVALRGIFVPGPADAPVVLHLMESASTIAVGAVPVGKITLEYASDASHVPIPDEYPPEPSGRPLRAQFQCMTRLRALGASCLIVDYEGIGESDGERSPDNLRRDAHAAFAEALRRAGGDPRHVIVRGTSIGTLAAACLLQDELQPAAVTLIAPVRAETVAPNFVRPEYGAILTSALDWFVADAVDVDLLEVLRSATVPVLVIVPAQDFLLTPEETALVSQAATEAGGSFIVRRNEHIPLSLAGRDLFAAEVAFYERRLPRLFPDREQAALAFWRAACLAEGGAAWGGHPQSSFDEGQPFRVRLHEILSQSVLPAPGLAIALVLAQVSEAELPDVADWLAWLPPSLWTSADLQALLALVSLEDPAGRLDASLLCDTIVGTNWVALHPGAQFMESFAALRRGDRGTRGAGFEASSQGYARVPNPQGALGDTLSRAHKLLVGERGLLVPDADRQVLRLYLKSLGVPDRLRADSQQVEVWESGAWRPCPMPPAEDWK